MSRVVQTHVLAGVPGLEHLIWQPSSGCLAAQRKVCRRESSPVQATQSPPSASDSSVFTPWWVVAWWRWRGSGWRLSSYVTQQPAVWQSCQQSLPSAHSAQSAACDRADSTQTDLSLSLSLSPHNWRSSEVSCELLPYTFVSY